jgi:hypothetical protein
MYKQPKHNILSLPVHCAVCLPKSCSIHVSCDQTHSDILAGAQAQQGCEVEHGHAWEGNILNFARQTCAAGMPKWDVRPNKLLLNFTIEVDILT